MAIHNYDDRLRNSGGETMKTCATCAYFSLTHDGCFYPEAFTKADSFGLVAGDIRRLNPHCKCRWYERDVQPSGLNMLVSRLRNFLRRLQNVTK